MLVKELEKHALGQRDMTQTQVRAAEVIIDRVLPKMQAVEHSGETETRYVVRMPDPIRTVEDWRARQDVIEHEPLKPEPEKLQ